MQKKKTLYPKWNSCFDAHLYEGRVIQIVAMDKPNTSVADISMLASALADKCTGGSSGPIWVGCRCRYWCSRCCCIIVVIVVFIVFVVFMVVFIVVFIVVVVVVIVYVVFYRYVVCGCCCC